MNSTASLLGVDGAAAALLPAQLVTLPTALAVLALALGSLWLLSSLRDDYSKLPGPPPSSWLLGHLPQASANEQIVVRTRRRRSGLWRQCRPRCRRLRSAASTCTSHPFSATPGVFLLPMHAH